MLNGSLNEGDAENVVANVHVNKKGLFYVQRQSLLSSSLSSPENHISMNSFHRYSQETKCLQHPGSIVPNGFLSSVDSLAMDARCRNDEDAAMLLLNL